MSSPCSSPSCIRPTLEKRRFLPSRKTDFPWVVYDSVRGMRCQYCLDAKKNNAFTKGCDKMKKGALTKHAATVDHRAAIEAKKCWKDM